MYIDEITQYCDEQYDSISCENCERECNHLCSDCLQIVHHGSNRDYDCKKITYYYVNNYIFKYSSEIQRILEKHKKLFNNIDEFNVLSIGCGPCTELIGFINFLSSNLELNQNINYLGVDRNDIWTSIHDKIRELINTVSFLYRDIESSDLVNYSPNFLIFQYVFSHIYKQKRTIDGTKEEISNFMNIVDKMGNNSYIILNDINKPYKATDYFNYFFTLVREKYPSSRMANYYFNDGIRYGNNPSYGNRFIDNSVYHSPSPNYRLKYHSYWSCSSAQMIIQVNK
jgi:hypothetical protein